MTYPKRSWFSLSFGMVGWIFAGFLVVGLALAVPAALALREGWRLSVEGVEVAGRVTSLGTSTHSCGKDNLDTCTSYDVGYAFEAGGVARAGNASVARSFYDGLQQGGPVAVRYVAADPAVSEIDIGTTLIAALALVLLAVVFLGLGGIGLGWRMRAAGRIVRLRDEGVVRRAEVTARERINVRVNNRPQYVIRWRDAFGGEGKSRMQAEGSLPPVGDSITTYADPAGILPAVWEGDSGTR